MGKPGALESKPVNRWVGSLGRAVGSLLLIIASVLLPVGTAAATPQADPLASAVAQQQDRRLANGQYIRSGNRTGANKLTIKNGASHDAVATMTINRKPVHSVYVRKGMQFTVTGIRDGAYELYFTAGTDWDSQTQAFTRDRAFHRLDRMMAYRSSSSGWTEGEVTLYVVPGGNTNISSVDPGSYPGP